LLNNLLDYSLEHSTFVGAAGYQHNDTRLKAGLIPIATIESELSEEEIFIKIKESQEVIAVKLL